MKIKVSKKIFLKALVKVGSTIERKSYLPVLTSVLLTVDKKEVKICATDLDCYITVDMIADIIESGSMAIPFFELNKFVKGLRENLYLTEKENNRLEISDGNATFNLDCISFDEFPILPELKGVSMAELDGGLLTEMIDKTSYAMDTDRDIVKGILIEREGKGLLRMVATDGYKLSMMDQRISGITKLGLGKEGIVMSRKGILLLRKLFAVGKQEKGCLGLVTDPVLLGVDNGYLVAGGKGIKFLVRLMDSKFPNYRNVIVREKKEGHLMKVNRDTLLKAMEKMDLVTTDRYQGVKLTTGTDYLEMVSVNPDLGDVEEKIEIKYDGKPIEIGFNPKYFIDALQTMDSDIIFLNIKDQTSPCLITGEQDEGFLGLIMPMDLKTI